MITSILALLVWEIKNFLNYYNQTTIHSLLVSIIIEDWYSILCKVFMKILRLKSMQGVPKKMLSLKSIEILLLFCYLFSMKHPGVLGDAHQKWVADSLIELNGYHR